MAHRKFAVHSVPRGRWGRILGSAKAFTLAIANASSTRLKERLWVRGFIVSSSPLWPWVCELVYEVLTRPGADRAPLSITFNE
jgi:hypothetical protein